MQRAQGGGGGTLGPSPWEQKIPARKQTQRSSGQGGTQQTQQTQQRQANSLASLLQLGQDLYQQAIQPVVMQAPQETTQETAGIYPEYTFDWGPWALGSAGIGTAAAVARGMLKRPSVTYLGYTPNALPAPPIAALPEPPNAKFDFRPIRVPPTSPTDTTPIAMSFDRLVPNAAQSTEDVVAQLGKSSEAALSSFWDNYDPRATPEAAARMAMEQTRALEMPLQELHKSIDWAAAAAGDQIEAAKANIWHQRFNSELAAATDLANDTRAGYIPSPTDSVDKISKWMETASPDQRAAFFGLTDTATARASDNLAINRAARGDNAAAAIRQQARKMLNDRAAQLDVSPTDSSKPIVPEPQLKQRPRATSIEPEGYSIDGMRPADYANYPESSSVKPAPSAVERVGADLNSIDWNQVVRPQPATSLTQLIRNNLKTFGSQLKGNAKIMAPIGIGLIGLSKLLEGSPAEAAVQPNLPQSLPVQTEQPNLSGLSDWGQVMYSTLPDQEKAQVASMSPAQQVSWERAETIKREGLQDAWNPLESLLYAPMAAGGSLVRMLANFLSDAVFQNAMLYGMSDGE